MADVPFNNADYAGINLPNMFGSPGDALKLGIAQKERQQARQDSLLERQRLQQMEQQQKDEMDLYRKTKMIQDLTDLSKHQTGSDVANAIGNEKVAELISKYTANVRNMSYSDLLSGITKDMSSTVSSLDALKNELDISDKAITQLKQQFPELNVSQLAKDLRADALNRRIGKGNTFVNPLEVPPSEFASRLTDPEFLSTYVTGNKFMVDEITNPKGVEEAKVFTGTPMENVRFEAKLPYWKQPTFNAEEVVGGFLPKGKTPALKIKSEVIPAEALPSSGNRPFNVIDTEVYKRFSQDPNKNLELIQSTRQTFPNYDNFNREEKELAKRHVLYNTIQALDKSDFIPAASTRAPISTTRINLGGKEADNVNMRDVYKEIEAEVNKRETLESTDQKRRATPINSLGSKAQNLIISAVKPLLDDDVSQASIMLDRDEKTGKIAVYKVAEGTTNIRGDKVAFLDELDVNIPAQVGIKEKREAVKQAQVAPTTKYTIKGKQYTEADLNKLGYSDEQIKEAIKLGTIKQ